MDAVREIPNVLSIQLLHKMHNYIQSITSEDAWHTNSHWNAEIINGSAAVLITKMDRFRDELIKELSVHIPEVESLGLTIPFPMFFSVPPMGFLNWHEDFTPINVSVYLNEFWDEKWGGFFLYENEGKIQGIKPEFNKAVIIGPNMKHSVTMIPPNCPTSRFSLQLFFVEKTKHVTSRL